MAASINSAPVVRERDLLGQTVLVIGGSSGPAGSAVMSAAYQPGRFASRWWYQESPLRFGGCVAPGRHPGAVPWSAGFRRPGRRSTLC